LRLAPSFPFVGRSRELAMLRPLMPRAPGEGRRIALVSGEPGAGKSRLVRELAHEAAARGTLVLYGACDAVVRTPYKPFVEALDQLVRASDAAILRADLGMAGGELTRLLPDLPRQAGELPEPLAADPDTERHRLHTAVTDLLTNVGHRQPLLLLLEDGHWADTSTLLLLRHLARAAAEARLLLVATFRDTDADVPGELREALADLRRSDGVVRIHLSGLTTEEVADFVRGAAGGDLGPELPRLAQAITELTAGNAFLMTEVWRALIETGALVLVDGRVRLMRPLTDLGSPESVREVVSQRLARLARSTRELLELAAVAGTEFELEIVRLASPLGDSTLLPALEEALSSGMIEEVPSSRLAYRFTHELVRRALYDRLGGIRRAELHFCVGEALEEAHAEDTARLLPDLAHHFARAAPVGGRERAVEYNLLAARAASAALAHDDAATRLRTALELGISDSRQRAEAQLDLGSAQSRAGKAADSLASFRAAAELARSLDDPVLLARAAVGFEDACWRPSFLDEGAIELLEEAAGALGAAETPLRVMVLSGLSRALERVGLRARGALVQREAIDMARRLGDPHSLGTVLMRSYWARGTDPMERILDMLTEAAALGRELGDIEIQTEASSWRVAAFMAVGDLESARTQLTESLAAAEKVGQPFWLHVAEHYGSALALCDGRLAEAEWRAERSREWAGLMTGRDASGVYGIQMFSLRREQGRLAELAPVIRLLVGAEGPEGSWRPALAVLLSELGMESEARRELDLVRADGMEALRSTLWIASLTYLTDACAVLDDEATAALVYTELEPLAGTNVMIGHGVAAYGAADRYLGMLASTLGDWGAARRHFEAALEFNRRMGASTWLAHTAYEFGRMLLAGGRREDKSAASALLAEAGALAENIGMRTLLERVQALAPAVGDGARLPDGLSAREVQILRLVAKGLSNREIGRELVISEHTAANHVRSILRKTRCANRTEAATYAHRSGLTDL
jgi:DNA-binding CsgD family transcriptional regulator